MNLPLSLIKYPSGRWGFVGRVPSDLAFIYEDKSDLDAALHSGPRIARLIAQRHGRVFIQRSWESEAAARTEAAALGYVISN